MRKSKKQKEREDLEDGRGYKYRHESPSFLPLAHHLLLNIIYFYMVGSSAIALISLDHSQPRSHPLFLQLS